MTIPLSQTPTVGLGQFIKEARFNVPSHQRDYSWKEEYVAQFIDDITAAMETKETLYFCGLMVFTKTDSPAFRVLDGQQRLATTIMILSAIRNWLGGYTAYNRARVQIDERYIGDSDLGQDTIESKIVLNAANNDVFRRYVIERVPIQDIRAAVKVCKKHDRNRALLEAALYLNERIAQIAASYKSTDEAKDYLLQLVSYLTNTVQTVRLIIEGDEAAYTIFETLNDRGMDLAPLDLVRNYLFSRAEQVKGKSLRDLEERWTEMMTLLSSAKADSFLRVFWTSQRGVPDGSKLFKSFKKAYADPAAAYEVSLSMREAAEHYVALTDAADPVWGSHSDKAQQSVAALSIIGATQMHPVMLAALKKFDIRENERLLRLLEVIAVRYQLVKRGRPGRIESLCGKLAKEISDGSVTSASQAMVVLKELYTSDAEFQADFVLKTERESKKAAYLLCGLERQSWVRAQDPHSSETAPNSVTVEHILPKSPGKEWAEANKSDPEFHEDCVFRLGNLCLLSDANRSLGNKGFDEKKKIYKKSKIRTTNSIGEYEIWDRDAVEKRQQHLAALAVAEWRFQ